MALDPRVPYGPPDDVLIPVGAEPVGDGDGDGDDQADVEAILGDICPGIETNP